MNKSDILLTIYLLLISDNENKESLNKYVKVSDMENVQFELYDFIEYLNRNGLLVLKSDYNYLITNLFEDGINHLLINLSKEINYQKEISLASSNLEIFNFIKKYLIQKDIDVSKLKYGYSSDLCIEINKIVDIIGDYGYKFIKISKNKECMLKNDKYNSEIASNYVHKNNTLNNSKSSSVIFTGAGFMIL